MKRLVVRAPNWLGDAVMALPALAALRAHFRDAFLILAAPASVSALFLEHTGVRPDAVLSVDRDRESDGCDLEPEREAHGSQSNKTASPSATRSLCHWPGGRRMVAR